MRTPIKLSTFSRKLAASFLLAALITAATHASAAAMFPGTSCRGNDVLYASGQIMSDGSNSLIFCNYHNNNGRGTLPAYSASSVTLTLYDAHSTQNFQARLCGASPGTSGIISCGSTLSTNNTGIQVVTFSTTAELSGWTTYPDDAPYIYIDPPIPQSGNRSTVIGWRVD